MPKKRYYDKMQEKKDGSMISGTSGRSGMPQSVIMKNYPKGSGYLPEGLNDGLSGVDSQKSSDVTKTKTNKSDTKY